MAAASDPVVILSAARTPLGRFMGELAPLSAHKLGSHVIGAALERAKLAPERIDEVFMGNVLPAGQGQAPARQADDIEFDTVAFTQLYATLAAQRATKILGIFARLDRRDGKPQYLRHMPRLWNYLQRSLAHPSLAALNAWYAANVPAPDDL